MDLAPLPAAQATPAIVYPLDADAIARITDDLVTGFKTVYDPEIPVDIYELGLIYKVDLDEHTGKVEIDMTLTSAACPAAQELPASVELSARKVAGVTDVIVHLVFDPPWTQSRMSDDARLELNML